MKGIIAPRGDPQVIDAMQNTLNAHYQYHPAVDSARDKTSPLGKMKDVAFTNLDSWVKVCHIHLTFKQGQFIRLMMLVGNGNNGKTNQNTMVDLVMQQGYLGDDNAGRLGCNYIYYPLSTGKTSIKIKVLATSGNTEYDVWLQANASYTLITYYSYYDGRYCTITDSTDAPQSTEPTSGTACNIQGGTVAYTTFS